MDWASSVFWRGGLLPLTLNDDYILGRDNKHSTLIDLGGHRELTDANILATAVREAKEESLGLIDINPAWLHSAYIYAGTALFPVNVPWTTEDLIQQFNLRANR